MKTLHQLREMTDAERSGARTDCGLAAVLLSDGSYSYYPDTHSVATAIATPDCVAMSYVGDDSDSDGDQ